MDKVSQLMFRLIRREAFGFAGDVFSPICDEDALALYRLSKKHAVDHLVGAAIASEGLIENEEISKKFQSSVLKAVYHRENLSSEIEKIKGALDEAAIDYVLLKGAVVADFYPEPWQRTSCDIDALAREEQVDRAVQTLVDKLGYELKEKTYHDYSLYSPSGEHLELHFNIKESSEKLDKILGRAWDYAIPTNEGSEFVFSNEFFWFHAFAHAAYHFGSGGCGVRPAIDLVVMREKLPYDDEKLTQMLKSACILSFAKAFTALSKAWFENGERDELTERMERYVLYGGIYGNLDSYIATSQVRRGGKFKNIMARIWLPYSSLVILYPQLKGKRVLQPFYEAKRWFKVMKKDVRKKCAAEIKGNLNIDKGRVESIDSLFRDLDLKI